jgi:hypothetical protein
MRRECASGREAAYAGNESVGIPHNRPVLKSLIGAPEFSTFGFSLFFFPCGRVRELWEALAMAPAIRTYSDVARWMAFQTALAAALVLPATALALLWLYGGDLSRPVGGLAVLHFVLALGAVEALVFVPALSIGVGKALRDLTLARDDSTGSRTSTP